MNNFQLVQNMVQNHIHLSDSLAYDNEGAPTMRWHVTHREETSGIFMTIRRALTGRLHHHVLTRNGVPERIITYGYTLRLYTDHISTSIDKRNVLVGLHGKRLYLVDVVHPPSGEDHRPYIRPVYIAQISAFKPLDPKLMFIEVDIVLEDDSL